LEVLTPHGALAAEVLAYTLGNSKFHPFGVFSEEECIDFIADAIAIRIVEAVARTIVVVAGEVADPEISGCGIVVAS
jgi:hypothetical protein